MTVVRCGWAEQGSAGYGTTRRPDSSRVSFAPRTRRATDLFCRERVQRVEDSDAVEDRRQGRRRDGGLLVLGHGPPVHEARLAEAPGREEVARDPTGRDRHSRSERRRRRTHGQMLMQPPG